MNAFRVPFVFSFFILECDLLLFDECAATDWKTGRGGQGHEGQDAESLGWKGTKWNPSSRWGSPHLPLTMDNKTPLWPENSKAGLCCPSPDIKHREETWLRSTWARGRRGKEESSKGASEAGVAPDLPGQRRGEAEN